MKLHTTHLATFDLGDKPDKGLLDWAPTIIRVEVSLHSNGERAVCVYRKRASGAIEPFGYGPHDELPGWLNRAVTLAREARP